MPDPIALAKNGLAARVAPRVPNPANAPLVASAVPPRPPRTGSNAGKNASGKPVLGLVVK